MNSPARLVRLVFALAAFGSFSAWGNEPTKGADGTKTEEVAFRSHDGHAMLGKLTVPAAKKPRAVVVYVQTAEGMTVDMKRPVGRETFNYFDVYRTRLPELEVAFFSYEGRGIKTGDKPPRFEVIDRAVYDTSTLDNKVLDALSAVATVQDQLGPQPPPVFLMGASEGTLLAAEAAARKPKAVAGLILYGVMSANMQETFRYINTAGAMLAYQNFFDTDGDGKVSRAEFEADPKKFRKNMLKGAAFDVLDKDTDGQFTVEDMKVLAKPILDAIDKPDFTVLDAWANGPAPAVSLPKGWFKDHFAHKPIWDFLSELDIPVGCFHGDRDASVPIAGVKSLEERAKKAGKSKMEFHYFPKADHSLNLGGHFAGGPLPDGHKAIFEYIKRLTR